MAMEIEGVTDATEKAILIQKVAAYFSAAVEAQNAKKA